MEQLSSAPDNELLNAAEVTRESSSVSVAKMLYENMFAGAPDASNPHFLAFISPLARSTKQQPVFNTRSCVALSLFVCVGVFPLVLLYSPPFFASSGLPTNSITLVLGQGYPSLPGIRTR